MSKLARFLQRDDLAGQDGVAVVVAGDVSDEGGHLGAYIAGVNRSRYDAPDRLDDARLYHADGVGADDEDGLRMSALEGEGVRREHFPNFGADRHFLADQSTGVRDEVLQVDAFVGSRRPIVLTGAA
jgi:hypothetical protein